MKVIDYSAVAPDGLLPLSSAIERLCKRRPIMWSFSKKAREDSLGLFNALLADLINGVIPSRGFNEHSKCIDEPIDARIYEIMRDQPNWYKLLYLTYNPGRLLAGGGYIESLSYSHVKLIFSSGAATESRRKDRMLAQGNPRINKGGAERKPAWTSEAAIAARIVAEYDYSLTPLEFRNKLKNCVAAAGIVDPHEDQQLNKLVDAVYECSNMDVENLGK